MKPRAPFLTVALSTATRMTFAGDPDRCSKAVDVHTDGHGAVADTSITGRTGVDVFALPD